MKQDQKSWESGYHDALDGKVYRTAGYDPFSYASGYCEGKIDEKTARLRAST